MRAAIFSVVALMLAQGAFAASGVANGTQKGSLLLFPDIDVRKGSTIVRLQNDGTAAVDVKCFWMDGNRNRVDFGFTLTKSQPFWFDAKTGMGTRRVNPFPSYPSNGYDNPYLGGADTGPYGAGLLACFPVNAGETAQLKWNHLSGTATVYDAEAGGAYEYNAYAFFVANGVDLAPIGTPGQLVLNAVDYDSCPLYQIGQMSPEGTILAGSPNLFFRRNRLAIIGCTLDFTQDWQLTTTKLQFDVWNGDEMKFSGAFDCADMWHETAFTDIDSASATFTRMNLGSDAARYRVQSIKSTQCPGSQEVGLLAIQSTDITVGEQLSSKIGTSLASAGKFPGRLSWDPSQVVPEGGIRP